MSPIQSRQVRSSNYSSSCYSEGASNFLIVLKIHGGDIHLRHLDHISIGTCKLPTFRVYCRDLDSSAHDSNIQVFNLDGGATKSKDGARFQAQKAAGQLVEPADLLFFMTSPMESSRKASYAIDIGVDPNSTSLEDLSADQNGCKRIGAAYLYLDPKFSTQGIQRMQVMGTHSQAPIGHIQVEYLVVRNPSAYGVKVPRPKWLSMKEQFDAGHRGAGSGCRGDLPNGERITENTVASFNYAHKHGADICELDVMLTSDGIPIIYHDYVLAESIPGVKQIGQLTLRELRALKDSGIHDKNCKHTKDFGDNSQATNQIQDSSKPFPTLEEVLREVNPNCALNIELKFPQMLPNGKNEAIQYREINDYVDRILDCIFEHSNGRAIQLSTFSSDIAIMLRLKQSTYPVLFITTGDSSRFHDPATKTVLNAIHFAQAFDLAGTNPNAAHLDEFLVRYAKERGLLVYAWGKIESAQAIKELRKFGLNGVIYDKIDLIKPQDW